MGFEQVNRGRITFWEDGLPLPTYRELATQADDVDKLVYKSLSTALSNSYHAP